MTRRSAANQTLVQFETRHIMPIPENERNGSVRSLFAIWVGINMLPLTVVTGAIATGSFGLSTGWSILAILTGNVVGAFGAALHASQGPHLGVPQMLQARAQFGFYGGSLFAFIALLMFLGFFASILVVAKDSLLAVLPGLNPVAVIVVFAVVGISIAVYGYDLLSKAMTALSFVIAGVVVVSMVLLWVEPAVRHANPTAGFSIDGFFGMLAIGVVWQLAYAPYVSDYSRYLPKTTGPKQAFWATYLGLVLSSVFVMILGVLLGAASPDNPLGAMASLLGTFGTIGLLIFAFSAAIINAAELYSGVMCALTTVNSTFRRAVLTTRARVTATLVCGVIAATGALAGESDFVTMFQNFVTILLYVLIPWSAINLADYFVVRKGHYAVDELFQRDGRYGRWNAVGLVTYAIGLAVQVPFMVTPMFTGPLAASLKFVDIAWILGFIVSGIVYLALTRRFGTPESLDGPATAHEPAVGSRL